MELFLDVTLWVLCNQAVKGLFVKPFQVLRGFSFFSTRVVLVKAATHAVEA